MLSAKKPKESHKRRRVQISHVKPDAPAKTKDSNQCEIEGVRPDAPTKTKDSNQCEIEGVKPDAPTKTKDSNQCENKGVKPVAKDKDVSEDSLVAENKGSSQEKSQTVDKSVDASTLENNGTMLNKEGNSLHFLEDGEAFDVLLLFETDSDLKRSLYPDVSVNCENVEPPKLKAEGNECTKESGVLEDQHTIDYMQLLNEVKELGIEANVEEPSAPDFTAIGEEIQECWEGYPYNWLYTEAAEEVKCVKDQVDIVELKSKVQSHNLKPFSEEELRQFYHNNELSKVPDFITDFIKKETNLEAKLLDPFYELLSNYLKAKNALQSCNYNLKSLDEKLDKHISQIWTVWNDNEIQKVGKCADGKSLSLKQKYMQAHFNEEAFENFKSTISEIRSDLFEVFKRESFNCLRYKLKIQIHVESLMTACKEITELNDSSPVSIVPLSRDMYFDQCLANLRNSIGILFFFQRKQKVDMCPSFLQESRQWLTDLVSVLIRAGSWTDHLFVLNHILRCPGGVGEWASCYIQFPVSELTDPFSSPVINHMMACLSILLQPIERRESFMNEWNAVAAPDESSWVMIDSDDEDEEATSLSSPLKENDLVMLLNQIPLKNLLTSILGLDNGKLNPQVLTLNYFEKIFSFCMDLIKILYSGLQVYSSQRYKQFVKRLGRLMCHIIEYITGEVDIFINNGEEKNAEVLERVQVEYDNFFLKSTKTIFSSREHGTWQYLTVVPYHRASEHVILELYNALQLSEMDTRAVLRYNLIEFEEKFVKLPESEQFYLLASFTSMALARNLSELDFIKAVVHQLLYIGFLSNLTKDYCYKNVKSLLFNMCNKHPFLISEILRVQNENFTSKQNRDQALTIYLWKELPVKTWKPASEELNILSSWLLKPVQSAQSELARIILKSLNYGLEQGDLFLSPEIHQMIAHIVMKASEKLYKDQETNIIKNVSSFVGLQEPEHALHSWSWNILLKLRLHLFDQSPFSVKNAVCNLHDSLKKIPELSSNPQLHELVEQKNPVACFLALMTTTLGHSVPIIYNEGFALVETLIRGRKCEAAIACIEYIILMFLECPDSLYKCTNFTSILSQLINADYSYLKLAKNLKASDTPGPILLYLENMIQNQIISCDELGLNRSRVIEIWIKSLTKLPLWNQESGVIYLMDSLCKCAFFDKVTSLLVRDIFSNSLQEIPSPTETKSSLASFVNWMNQKNSIPTLLPRGYNGNAVWFFLKAMEIERDHHETSNFLWQELLKELQTTTDKKTNVDNCLKKACNNLQIPIRTSETLIIYRLCYQILETKITHPAVIVLWQNFFLLYFCRVSENVDGGSVGYKFFHGMLNQSLLNKMKSRLEETLNCFSKLHQQCDKSDQRSKYFSRCTQILNVFRSWIDEPKLHEPNLNLRLLPPKYDPELFATVVEQNNAVWTDYIDHATFQSEINKNAFSWQELKNRNMKNVTLPKPSAVTSDKSLAEKMQESLMRYENPLPPPQVTVIKTLTLVPLRNFALCTSAIPSYLRPSFRTVMEYADYYVQEIGEYVGLSCDLQELVKLLYKVKNTCVTVRETCNGYEKVIKGNKFNFKCSGPAVAILSFEESEVNKKCYDLFNQVLRNFNRNVQRSLLPLQKNIGLAAVTIEKIIEELGDTYHFWKKQRANDSLVLKLGNTGVGLFYDLLDSWTDSVSATQPIAAVLQDCIHFLGRSFIANNPSECEKVLAKINDRPKLIDKLQPHFNPNISSVRDFIELYCKARKSLSNVRFQLLSKFNLDQWLTEKNPRFYDISRLISEIGIGLKTYGPSSNDDMGVIQIFNSHLQQLLLHDFPEHYGEVLNLLLEGSESQTIPASTWFTFLNAIAPEGIVFVEGKRDSSSFEPGQGGKKLKFMFTQYATHQTLLSLSNIRETMGHLGNTFKIDRLQHGIYGLYPKYHNYVEPILIFCGMLSHSFVAETLKLDLGSLSMRITDQLWPLLKDLYSPWLVPYWSKQEKAQSARWIQELTDDKCVLLPWVCSDVPFASYSCGIFIDSIRFVFDTLPGVNSVLSHVWAFYVTNYAHIQVKDHVLRIIHKNLLQLPWSTFSPSLQDIEQMVKVVEHFLPMSHSLLGNIFVEVKWVDVVKNYLTRNKSENLEKLHVYLLHLLVKLPFEPSLKQNNDIVLLLTEAKYFSWHLVDAVNYEYVLNWFVMSCDPRIVLNDDKSEYYKLDLLILQILRICAGFGEITAELHPTTLTKRLMYVRANNKWLTTANNRFKCKDSPLFKSAFVRILNEIEGTINESISEIPQSAELATLLSTLLNIFKEEELVSVLEETLINWFNQKRCCIMINGLLRSIALSAISPSIFGNIADACLDCYFESNDNGSWSDINANFVTYASGQSGLLKTTLITNGNLLTLYTIILKQCSDITNLLEEKIIINEIFQSITSVKRSEAVEPKLVLMIMHAFKIADTIGKLDDGESISILTRLSTYLNNIYNDKGNGLLSTFGLRKSDCFTNRFKFICLLARAGIVKLFQTRYATQDNNVDEKVLLSLDQALTNKRYQTLSQYASPAVEEMKKIETVDDIITILKTLGFQIFKKNYFK